MGLGVADPEKGFTFDSVDYKTTYGVYVNGTDAYNAPDRDVEVIAIPGRDGAFIQDKGRFNNTTVTYHCVLAEVDEDDFADAISDLRNDLASRKGYKRLVDEFNPNEYRMAAFVGGLDASNMNPATGEFDITFECKPQRWMTTGETAVSVSSGNSITNPTLFESRPMLQVWGYGSIDLGGQPVSLSNVYVGNILISNGGTDDGYDYQLTPDYTMVNTGDTLTIGASNVAIIKTKATGISGSASCTNPTVTWAHGSGTASIGIRGIYDTTFNINATPEQCNYGTANSAIFEVSITGTFRAYDTSMNIVTADYTIVVKGAVNAAGVLSITSTFTKNSGTTLFAASTFENCSWGQVYADSTKSALGSPTYIDLDIGEAYYISGSDIISADSALTLPAQLPTLPPGATTITYDNTITQFKVVPRWWKV